MMCAQVNDVDYVELNNKPLSVNSSRLVVGLFNIAAIGWSHSLRWFVLCFMVGIFFAAQCGHRVLPSPFPGQMAWKASNQALVLLALVYYPNVSSIFLYGYF